MSRTEATGEELTKRGQATRDRIVNAAAELMTTQGVAAVSMRDVRDAANVSGSQLTHYFGDKQSLIRAVIEHQADAVIAVHQMPQLGRLDTFDKLELWAKLNIESLESRNCQAAAPTAHSPANWSNATPRYAATWPPGSTAGKTCSDRDLPSCATAATSVQMPIPNSSPTR